MESVKSAFRSVLDVLAVVGPILCLIDCIVIPIAILLLPFASFAQVAHGVSDQMLALLMILFCAPALIPGYLRHRRKRVLVLSGIGFALVFFASFAGHAIDELLHFGFSATGSFFLIKANLENRKLQRGCGCAH